MEQYMEIIEELDDIEILERLPVIVRVVVQDETEAKGLYGKYENIFTGRNYRVQYHIHKHSTDSKNWACEVKEIKKVKAIKGEIK